MTDTPETDAAAFEAFDGQGGEVVFADFAKKLERERDEARRALRSVMDWNPKPASCAACWTAFPARFNADMARAWNILEATK